MLQFIKKRLKKSLILIAKKIIKNIELEKYNLYRIKYTLDPTVKFNGKNIQFYGDGDLTIGKHTYIGENSAIQLTANHSVTIGRNCAISHGVRIYTSTYISDSDFDTQDRPSKSANINIGNGVWIGYNVLITPGVSIGNNVVIGANSVVVKDIPDNAIASGIPATIIRFKKI